MLGRTIPIIRFYDLLIVSIQVDLTDDLIEELKESVSTEIAGTEANALVIEVSGVELFDSYMAASIRSIAHIARLMGTRTVLAGLDAATAITLVEMGMSMDGVETALNLESAVEQLRWNQAEAQEDALSEALEDEDMDEGLLDFALSGAGEPGR